jgi:FkbM family methyltransferase
MGLGKTLGFIWNHPLNRTARCRAVTRFFGWQIVSNLSSGKRRIHFVNETVLMISRGMHGATGNIYVGLHEPDDMGFVLHALKPGELFADVGANVGSYSVLALATGANAVAFEPVPRTFRDLRENVEANHALERVDLRNEAVGAEGGELKFTSSHDAMNHVVSAGESSTHTVTVPVVTLDSALGDRVPVVMKIDVEGYEGAVLAGATRTLSDPRLLGVVMEIGALSTRYGFAESDVRSQMVSSGFVACSYSIETRLLRRQSDGFASNTIFVRDPDAMQQRLKSAPKFRLWNGCV